MNTFLSYILLGISLAAPIGPINAAQIDKGIKYGFLHSYLVGFGAMVADFLFMMFVFFGSAHFLTAPFLRRQQKPTAHGTCCFTAPGS